MGESLYAYFDQIGKPIVRAAQHVRVAMADKASSRQFAIAIGELLLLVSRIGYTHGDLAIEFTKTYSINDYYDFVVKLKR